jgi:hypothetical protein
MGTHTLKELETYKEFKLHRSGIITTKYGLETINYWVETSNGLWRNYQSKRSDCDVTLLKTKLYTEQDMRKAFYLGHQTGINFFLAMRTKDSPQPIPKDDVQALLEGLFKDL